MHLRFDLPATGIIKLCLLKYELKYELPCKAIRNEEKLILMSILLSLPHLSFTWYLCQISFFQRYQSKKVTLLPAGLCHPIIKGPGQAQTPALQNVTAHPPRSKEDSFSMRRWGEGGGRLERAGLGDVTMSYANDEAVKTGFQSQAANGNRNPFLILIRWRRSE